MQLTIEQIKELIIWAKSEKVKILEVSGIRVEFTELAFIDQIQGLEMGQSANPEVTVSTKTFADEIANEDDEELLFHSSLP